MRQKVCTDLDPGTAVALALWILTVPLPWTVGAVMAATVHELCHICAIRFLKISMGELRFCDDGLCLYTGHMTPLQEGICAGAGPVGSLLLVLCLGIFPEMAICGLAQGVFNLLPVYPLDGGRILKAILAGCGQKKRRYIMCIAGWFAIFLTVLTSVWAIRVFTRYRLLISVSAVVIGVRLSRKIPCNAHGLEVQ